jgi:hypothetical protein
MSWVLIAWLGAAASSPCNHLAEATDEVARATSASEQALDETTSHLEAELGRPLLRHFERSMAPNARADLLIRRVKAACALRSKISGAPLEPVDRERLKEILARPEFAGARRRTPDWLARWLGRIQDWINSLFAAQGAQSFASWTRALVFSLAIAAALAGAIRLARRRRIASTPGRPIAVAPSAKLRQPAAYLAQAQRALGSNPREAIRLTLLALLAWLEEQRLARANRTETNRELARELSQRGASQALSEAVARLLHWYDGAFYSLSSVSSVDAQRFIRQVADLSSGAANEP